MINGEFWHLTRFTDLVIYIDFENCEIYTKRYDHLRPAWEKKVRECKRRIFWNNIKSKIKYFIK